jgi:CRP-like cAMP-binding protein
VHGRRATRKSKLRKRESIPGQRGAPQRYASQLIHVLERFGIEPDGRLTAEDLAGLPLPERLFE